MAAKGREKIRLVSTAKNKKGETTGTFYTTDKNKSSTQEKLEFKKYDARAYNAETGKTGMHVLFREEKIK